MMIQSRRHFLGFTASTVAAWACGTGLLAGQVRGPGPVPSSPGNGNSRPPYGPFPNAPFPDGPFEDAPAPVPKRSPAQQMKINQAEIEKDMVRLKAAVAELEKEFNSNDTTNVLSMAAVHKAEEIEKLARHIRDLVHG
jgi:hypothetical protein